MGSARESFVERQSEVRDYLEFLQQYEVPSGGIRLSATQINVMKSSIFLQLYNLVESTVALSCEDLAAAIVGHATIRLQDLSNELRSEWIRIVAKTGSALNPKSRHEVTSKILDDIIGSKPVERFNLNAGGGGNWDNERIRDLGRKIGVDISLDERIEQELNSEFYNSDGPVKAIRSIRNALAHGNLSFGEIGQLKSVSELLDLCDITCDYLSKVIDSFEEFISSRQYLKPMLRA